MIVDIPVSRDVLADENSPAGNQTRASSLSWGAIIAGAVTAAAISTILLLFGAGLGLSTISPWPHSGASITTFTVLAAIWLIIVQWVSSAFGGYMAGRLRMRWVGVHADEVMFRDTAHGFLAWGLATLMIVLILVSASSSAVGTGSNLASATIHNGVSNGYYVDLLFRRSINPDAAANSPSIMQNNGSASMVTGMSDQQTRSEATTILAEAVPNGRIDAADEAYLTQLVSARTGLAPADAERRVNDVLIQEQTAITGAKQIADKARAASAMAAIYTFVALLIGAFIASVAGAIGGRLRDNY